ncbi:MAG: hypothetical protein HYW50_02155 [Candidatus Diapherotrites archaeon]|nr:hypothetical protein [Candidatus Diapherotrites archaeon]
MNTKLPSRQLVAKGYAPAHITGFFKIYKNGSTGAGLNLSEGVRTKVIAKPAKKTKIEIFINGKKTAAGTSRTVAKKYLKVLKKNYWLKIFHSTKLPIGYGLGASGAGALSLSLALNKALKTNFSKKTAVRIAKEAEIENGTGLGDVIAQQFFGVIRGLLPFPSKKAANIPCKKKYCVCAFFAPIKTSTIISSKTWKQKVNKAGSYCMKQIAKKPTVKNFINLSRVFSIESGLATKKVRKIMDELPGASQAMLGSTAFVITDNPEKIAKKLKKFSYRILVSKIAKHGAGLL